MAAGERGERRDGRSVVRAGVGEIAAVEAEGFFDEGGLLFGRGDDGVDDQVIDGVKAGGVEIAEPTEGDGRGLVGEGEQTVAGGVAGKIDEDVDFVARDAFGEFEIGEAGGFAPAVGGVAHALGPGVGFAAA